MRLEKLILALEDKVIISGKTNTEVLGLEYDSRRVLPGYLFIAVPGMNFDGHKFIPDAISNGAVAVMGEKEMDLGEIPYIQVKDSRRTLARISAEFYGNPAQNLKIVGITGTNGKTTTTYLLKAILEQSRFSAGIIGTVGVLIGEDMLSAKMTTPEALELNKYFKDMIENKVPYAVMEVSSHSLRLHRVDDIPFETAVFTNLTQDHLDFHENMDDYFEAKALLFTNAKKAVINADDPAGEKLIKRLSIPIVTYGIEKPSQVKAGDVRVTGGGVYYNVETGGKSYPVFYGVPGRFSVYNSLAAIAAGVSLDISINTILEALSKVKGVPGRFETVNKGQDFTVIVDYSHTPDSLKNAINAAASFSKGRIITVFGCGGDRDRKKRPVMGEIASTLSDFCIITSDNPRSEDPDAIIGDIVKGCSGNNYEAIADRKAAIHRALLLAKTADVVLIAGKGHETYQVLKDRTIHFDDRETAANFLVSEV